jgi:hypothetical protein
VQVQTDVGVGVHMQFCADCAVNSDGAAWRWVFQLDRNDVHPHGAEGASLLLSCKAQWSVWSSSTAEVLLHFHSVFCHKVLRCCEWLDRKGFVRVDCVPCQVIACLYCQAWQVVDCVPPLHSPDWLRS